MMLLERYQQLLYLENEPAQEPEISSKLREVLRSAAAADSNNRWRVTGEQRNEEYVEGDLSPSNIHFWNVRLCRLDGRSRGQARRIDHWASLCSRRQWWRKNAGQTFDYASLITIKTRNETILLLSLHF